MQLYLVNRQTSGESAYLHQRPIFFKAMFDWSDTVFRRRNVTRRRISNTVLQPRYWGREADSPEVCLLTKYNCIILVLVTPRMSTRLAWKSGKNKFPEDRITSIKHCFEKYWSLMKVRNQPTLRRMKIYYYWTNIRKWNYSPEVCLLTKYNCIILVLVTPRMSTRLAWKSGKNKFPN
jgi:hypothetical protein